MSLKYLLGYVIVEILNCFYILLCCTFYFYIVVCAIVHCVVLKLNVICRDEHYFRLQYCNTHLLKRIIVVLLVPSKVCDVGKSALCPVRIDYSLSEAKRLTLGKKKQRIK